jgi:glycosyltransferase involved in cell wall biosynthesis
VFVQAFEPRDAEILSKTQSNLIPVPVAANWWVDDRLFYPIAETAKDVDAVMVAGWGDYKRHASFFRALREARNRGRKLSALLLGYPLDRSMSDIMQQAAYFGVADQIEAHEWIPYDRINEFLNRAKVCVLWSRREGVNRAIIEAMFAGLPCIVREGFNYGYHYPYINDQTGSFATEASLPEKLIQLSDNYRQFSPRSWVETNMSCHKGAEILSQVIGEYARSQGEAWTGRMAVKINKLDNVVYWDPGDRARFEPDYAWLRTLTRK